MQAAQNQTSISLEQEVFLRVSNSVRGKKWISRLAPGQEALALSMAQSLDVPEIIGRVLAARGVTVDSAAEYLNPTLKSLMPDPSSILDMDRAAERFAKAIEHEHSVAVFGDYDVDGGSSAALIQRFLSAHGQSAEVYIPDRTLEGYGPNIPAFEQLVEQGAELILTVDCGTMSHEPIARANELGVDVIVLDHHQADEDLPTAYALVNPNRQDDISGQGDLAAAGVVFMFLVATHRHLRKSGLYEGETEAPDLIQFLDLVALATVCDVVPLTGLNRAFVTRGLQVMAMRSNTGLRALCDTARLTSTPTPYHLGYVLGPRLNAGGRIGRSNMANLLLSTDDEILALEIASELESVNAERRSMQERLEEEAVAICERFLDGKPDSSLAVAGGEGWHKGLVGLVAARLVEKFSRPALAISWDKEGTGSGSARSIHGADIGNAIRSAVEEGLLVRGGGHEMAAGFTLTKDMQSDFLAHMDEQLGDAVSRASLEQSVKLDGAVMASSATIEFLDLLDRAGPYGAGNPSPCFALPSHRIRFAKVVGDSHVRCSLAASDGSKLNAIAFNCVGEALGDILLQSDGLPLHVAGYMSRNEWNGRTSVELRIVDAAKPV